MTNQTVMGVANSDGERVRGVRFLRARGRDQDPHHRLHLGFVSVAAADHRFLDRVGGVFGDLEPRHRRRQQRHAARLAEHQRIAGRSVDEGFLNRRFVRRVIGDDCLETFENRRQSLGAIGRPLWPDDARGDKTQARTGAIDDPPSGYGRARVNAENANYFRHGRTMNVFAREQKGNQRTIQTQQSAGQLLAF